MNISFRLSLIILLTYSSLNHLQGQTTVQNSKLIGSAYNAIQTAVPFLTIAPDSRAGGMGDLGVATTPDINSMHWNPAKYAFIKEKAGFSVSYLPWLRNLVPDINMGHLSGFYKIDKTQTISASLLYFSLGQIIFKDEYNIDMGQYNPHEFSLDAAYSRLFSEYLSGGVAFRYIRSDFGRAFVASVGETKAGNSFAADVSSYYQRPIEIQGKDAKLAFGLNVSNMGAKISYTATKDKEFIPINMRLGTALTMNLDQYNSFMIAADFNKLLVPSPPIYTVDSLGRNIYDNLGNKVIAAGKDPNVGVPAGMLQSFYDAPGGYKEEIKEIQYSLGMEYSYRSQFALRGGYFHESQSKGNRKFYTVGIGLKYNVMIIDFAYMIPVGGRTSPLANTVRFTLGFNFGTPAKK